MSTLPPKADIRQRKTKSTKEQAFARAASGCFGYLAAVALAWAIFAFRASTRRSAPLIGLARGSSEPDWLRGFRITAFPLRIGLNTHPRQDGRDLLVFDLLQSQTCSVRRLSSLQSRTGESYTMPARGPGTGPV